MAIRIPLPTFKDSLALIHEGKSDALHRFIVMYTPYSDAVLGEHAEMPASIQGYYAPQRRANREYNQKFRDDLMNVLNEANSHCREFEGIEYTTEGDSR